MAEGIKQMIRLLQDLHVDVEGVAFAPRELIDYPTGDVSRSHLPCALTFPEDGTWQKQSIGSLNVQTRAYRVLVLVADYSSGVGFEPLDLTADLIQRFGEVYTNSDNQLLQSNPEIALQLASEGITDTGYLDGLLYRGKQYHGFEFEVPVHEKK